MLSSTNSSSEESRQVTGTRTLYEPYGTPLTTPRDGAPSYTGHQYDTGTGLIYAQQRYYDPQLGVFYSPDPMAVDTTSAFNFNRYAYANNSPYKFTDPDGRWSAEAHDEIIDNSLSDKVSAEDIGVIQQSSRDFDKRTQGPDQSHMHSMAQKGQSGKDAKTARDTFIRETIIKARDAADSGGVLPRFHGRFEKG